MTQSTKESPNNRKYLSNSQVMNERTKVGSQGLTQHMQQSDTYQLRYGIFDQARNKRQSTTIPQKSRIKISTQQNLLTQGSLQDGDKRKASPDLKRPSTNINSEISSKLPTEKTLDVQAVATKLAYEWKNIYRYLSSNESMPRGRGMVTADVFDQALEVTNVRLTK